MAKKPRPRLTGQVLYGTFFNHTNYSSVLQMFTSVVVDRASFPSVAGMETAQRAHSRTLPNTPVTLAENRTTDYYVLQYPSHTGGKQDYGLLRFATQKKMYNYVQVSREKWGYVDKGRTT